MDLQINDFYHDVAAALVSLYQSFPRQVALYVEDLIGHEEPDEFGLPTKRHQACLGTLLWLADEGYLRYDNTIQFLALDQAVLTEKGFVRLSRAVPDARESGSDLPPSVLRARSTLANQLRQALHERDSERLAHLAGLIFLTGSGEKPVL